MTLIEVLFGSKVPLTVRSRFMWEADEVEFKKAFKAGRITAQNLKLGKRIPTVYNTMGPNFKVCVKIGERVYLNKLRKRV